MLGFQAISIERAQGRARKYHKIENWRKIQIFGQEIANPLPSSTVITDPDDSKFDLEVYLNHVAAESP